MTKNAILGVGLLALIILAVFCIWTHAESILAVQVGPSPFVDFAADAETIVVNGVMPDDATKKQLVTRAEDVFGAGRVIDHVRVADTVGAPSWIGDVLDVMPLFVRGVNNAGIRVSGDTLTLRGEVVSREAKADILQKVVATVNNILVVNSRLVVVARGAQLARAQRRLDDELKGKTIVFEIGTDRITPEGAAILDSLIPIMQSFGDASIEIAGHTDSSGKEAVNRALSQARAQSVKNYCVEKGVHPDRLRPVGYGSTKPVASNATPSGRLANRRTEFHVL